MSENRGLGAQLVARNSPSAQFPWRTMLSFSLFYLLCSILLLGVPLIGGSSEAREAKVVDEIVTQGEWILPLRNGVIPSKPPFFHWVGAAVSLVVGEVSPLTVRLPSLMFGFAVLWLTAFIGFRLAPLCRISSASHRPELVALLSWCVLSLTYGFHQLSSFAMVDMSFTFFVTIALASPFITPRSYWDNYARVSPGARFAFWFACSGAVLARGPIGVVLPVLLVGSAAWYCVGYRKALSEILRPTVFWILFAVPLVWYLAAARQGGNAFVDRQLIFENLRRVVGGEHINSESWWFYLPSFFRTSFPWGILAVVLLWARGSGRGFSGEGYRPVDSRAFIAPTISLLCGVLLFSIPSGKRHSYLLPLYSLMAVQIGLLVTEMIQSATHRVKERALTSLYAVSGLLVMCALFGLVALGAAPQFLGSKQLLLAGLQPHLSRLSIAVGIVILLAVTPFFKAATENIAARVRALWFVAFGFMACAVCSGSTIKAALKDFPAMAGTVLSFVRDGEQLVVIKGHFDEYFDPILFYVRRSVALEDLQAEQLPCENGKVYLVREAALAGVEEKMQGKVVRLGVVREFADAVANVKKFDRDIIVFRCEPATPIRNETTHSGGVLCQVPQSSSVPLTKVNY